MAYYRFIFSSSLKTDDSSFISISKSHIRFSSEFVRISKVNQEHKVLVFIDDDERKIKFEFSKSEKENCLSLTQPKGKSNFQISSSKLYKEIDWLRSFANLNGKERHVSPKKIGNAWEVSLMPSFENSVLKKDIKKIGSETKGIYRYKNSQGLIVYIGKGQIYTRYNEEQRKQWDFDIIEYSEVVDTAEQFRWENHWIEEFKKVNNGKLPIYNKINGKKSK